MINGARVSLTMGFLPTAGSLLAGMLLGALAAYRGGWIDNAVMRVCDILTCVPGILLSLTFVMILGTGLNNVLIAITVAAIPAATRYVRAVVLNIVGLDYIEAGRACGTGTFGIIRKHVLPNAFGPLLLFATSNISAMLLMGAGLSFLGLGIQPPYPEWGSMLNEAREYVLTEPWLFLFPGVAIMISMLAFNLVGDALRDALDPKLRR
ncbi:MAG: ABC transporter permease [Clostridiales bacterium]|nr:ABC transporter permease [Clostridiales bacterium]